MNLPAGVTQRQDLEVAPKAQPMSTEGINALAKQKRREAEEMEALLERRRQAEQDEQDEKERQAQAKAQAEEKKRQKAAQEAQRWQIINAQTKPSGHHVPHPHQGIEAGYFERVIVCSAPLAVPILVGDDLLVKPLGIALEVFTLESPVVDAVSAMLLESLYLDEVNHRWQANIINTLELMGEGAWLYTAAMPSVVVVDAGPINPQTDRPSHTHKIVRAVWGDCYIHNPIHNSSQTDGSNGSAEQ